MANTTFNGPVRSENGFEIVVKNNITGTYRARQASGALDTTNMGIANTATATNLTLADRIIDAVNYTGAAACTVALPAAISGVTCAYIQSIDTAGGLNTLTFNAAGTDAWALGTLIESRAGAAATMDSSGPGEGQLVFTPANAATNLFTTGSMISFQCFEDGVWTIFTKGFGGAATATTGAFAFAA